MSNRRRSYFKTKSISLEMTYDEHVGMGYIYLRRPEDQQSTVTSEPLPGDQMIVVDFSKDGSVAGFELPRSAFPPEILALLRS